jgi:hypothetical protein
MSNWETLFFQNAAHMQAISVKQLCVMRLVCNRWTNAIETIDDVYEKLIDVNILKRLFYRKRNDGKPSTYGKDYYNKLTIRNRLKNLWEHYNSPLMVRLDYVEDDLFEGDTVIAVESGHLPWEFEMFIKWYKEYPNTRIRLYRPELLRKLLKQQIRHTQDRLDCVDNIVHLTPICYSKHYKGNMDDRQFINVLCYVNALDEAVLNDLGGFYERFHVITLEIEDMQDKNEHYEALCDAIFDLTDKIESDIGYIEDLDLMTFCQCYDRLIKKQRFNL